MQGSAQKLSADCDTDSQGVFYLHTAKHGAVTSWLPFSNKGLEKLLRARFDAILKRQPSGKRVPGSKGSASSHTPNVAAAPAYTYVLQGAGLLVQQAVSNVAGCCLHTAPHVAATSSAAVSLTGYLSNLDEVVERLALSDGIALGSYGAGSDQGSVAAEALLQIFLKSTFNPLVALSELQGQFAFAAYDAEKKQVFAARDSSGKEQLFYSFGEDGVSFANKLLSAPGLEETWRELLPGHYVYGRNPREVQQFALTPAQLIRLSMREAAEDDRLSSNCLSCASTPRRSPLSDSEAPLAPFSLREAFSNRSSSMRSSTELDPRVRNSLLASSV